MMIYCRRYIEKYRYSWREYLRRIKKFLRILFYDKKIKEADIILISASCRNYAAELRSSNACSKSTCSFSLCSVVKRIRITLQPATITKPPKINRQV